MTHQIIVLGAGYAGAVAAGRLARRLSTVDVTITLINAEPDFVERVRLHQIACGQQLKPRPLSRMFAGTGVQVQIAEVVDIDTENHQVMINTPDVGPTGIGYDTLVYALGSRWNPGDVPGVAAHAHQVANRAGALGVRDRLADPQTKRVTVVGGGLTGIETATEIAQSRTDLEVSLIISDELGDWLPPAGRRHLRRVIPRLGITAIEHRLVAGVETGGTTLDDGTARPADLTVWCTGFIAPPLAATTPLALAGNGQIMVDKTMRSVSDPFVYAVGDAAYAIGPGDRPLRMSCASGIPTAWQASEAIAARLAGRHTPKTPLRYTAQCISLGRRDGLLQFVTADDRPQSAALTGTAGARIKERLCRTAAWAVANPTLGLPVRKRKIN